MLATLELAGRLRQPRQHAPVCENQKAEQGVDHHHVDQGQQGLFAQGLPQALERHQRRERQRQARAGRHFQLGVEHIKAAHAREPRRIGGRRRRTRHRHQPVAIMVEARTDQVGIEQHHAVQRGAQRLAVALRQRRRQHPAQVKAKVVGFGLVARFRAGRLRVDQHPVAQAEHHGDDQEHRQEQTGIASQPGPRRRNFLEQRHGGSLIRQYGLGTLLPNS
ncbi:MAG: hypothetical protein V4508_06180 [Pseudomonadota bacterium]